MLRRLQMRAIGPRPFRTLTLTTAVAVVVGLVVVLGLVTEPAQAAFPGNNGKIAFYRWPGGGTQLFVMDAVDSDGDGNGDNTTFLPTNSGVDHQPAWSPDGSKLAFARFFQIYMVSADDPNNPIRLTNLSPAVDWMPTWSPDGDQIAFVSNRDGNYEIYVMDADDSDGDGSGDNLKRLTSNSATDAAPDWSPDGDEIAFYSDRDGSSEIYVMDKNGSNPTKLTNTSPAGEGDPDWSPDGKKIAYGSANDLYVMNADGSNQTNLTKDGPGIADASPSWSPDGTKIAWQSSRVFGWSHIWVMNPDGSTPTLLTNVLVHDYDPDWGARLSDLTSFYNHGANPALVDPNQTTVVSAKLRSYNAYSNSYRAVPNRSIEVWSSTDNGTTWAKEGTATYDAANDLYRYTSSPLSNNTLFQFRFDPSGPLMSDPTGFQFRFGGDIWYKAATSQNVEVRVRGASFSDPAEAIESLTEDVNELVESGTLKESQGKALHNQLEGALAQLQKDHEQEATEKLQGFTEQVDTLITDDKLSSDEGQALIEVANEAIELINE